MYTSKWVLGIVFLLYFLLVMDGYKIMYITQFKQHFLLKILLLFVKKPTDAWAKALESNKLVETICNKYIVVLLEITSFFEIFTHIVVQFLVNSIIKCLQAKVVTSAGIFHHHLFLKVIDYLLILSAI